jgi:hypothetical protein
MIKLSNTMARVNESICVTRCFNGYTIEFSGQNIEAHFVNMKIVCNSLDDVIVLLKEFDTMPTTN